MTLKVAIVLSGKFHADQMACALLGAGHDVRIWTTLPKNRFSGVSPKRIHSFIPLEILHRVAAKFGYENCGDLAKIRLFGKACALSIGHDGWKPDLLIAWSSFGLPCFQANPTVKKVIVRDSAHITNQMKVFEPEFNKWNAVFPNRSVCVQRELEEYSVVDHILVCSDFIRQTFLQEGIPANKLKKIMLGVNTSVFAPKTEYNRKLPLKVVYFGGLSIYKGVFYLLEATRHFSRDIVELTLIGALSRDFKPLLDRFNHATVLPPMPHSQLSEFIRSQDVFVMPSLQDGFGQTVPQAMASGLACVVSENCGSKELIAHLNNGVIIPVASSSAIRKSLEWFIEQPSRIEEMGQRARQSTIHWSWKDYGRELCQWITETFDN